MMKFALALAVILVALKLDGSVDAVARRDWWEVLIPAFLALTAGGVTDVLGLGRLAIRKP